MRTGAILMALLLGGCAAGPAVIGSPPAATDAGVLAFQSAGTLQRSPDRRNIHQGAPIALAGELQFPPGAGPFPALVLAHGCNGNRNIEPAWGALLRSWGYATFVIDSFRPRGINEVCTNAQSLLPLQRVPDAYGALRFLAAHPRLDAKRISLIGFSHGGALAMLASTAWAKETYAAAGAPAFRAFFPFYPNCNAVFPERNRVSAPVRIHTGEADDWTPAKPCAELAQMLQASGQDVAIQVYPGAHHAFDQARGHMVLANVNNGSGCFPRLPSILGPLPPVAASGLPPPCVKKGATIAGSPGAAADARKILRTQLDELMR